MEPQSTGLRDLQNLVLEQAKWRSQGYQRQAAPDQAGRIRADQTAACQEPALYLPERPAHPAGEPKPKLKVDLSELLPLKLQRVTTQADCNLWRELIDRYHYLGYNNVAGAQMRYLVYSPVGIVALFGFGASAWHVKDRDQWIGWDEEQRLQFRYLVVGNTRFLILPWIKCKNLASKLLSLVTSRLRDDFRDAYNYAPVLVETFVDQEHFWGTSYKAANWRFVGATQGRGRNGRKKAKLPIKSVYLYPLTRDFRLVLTSRKIPD